MPTSSKSSRTAALRAESSNRRSTSWTEPPGNTYAPGANSAPRGRRIMSSRQCASPWSTTSTEAEGRGLTGGPSWRSPASPGGVTDILTVESRGGPLGFSAVDLGLAGKTALVTGAARAIGLAIARALAAEGARVAVAARTRADVERVAGELGGVAVAADLTTGQGCREAMGAWHGDVQV